MIAGSFIDICLVVAFLMPMRSNVASIVSEKELRLREGMRLLGVTDLAYWTSWVLTHLTQLLLMSAGMSTFATITFPESNAFVTFLFFALMSMSLIPLAYLLSCFFYRTSTAGPAAVLIALIGGITLLGLFGDGPIAQSALTILSISIGFLGFALAQRT